MRTFLALLSCYRLTIIGIISCEAQGMIVTLLHRAPNRTELRGSRCNGCRAEMKLLFIADSNRLCHEVYRSCLLNSD